jgi:uncharacterized DUF497 family protein
MRINEIIWLENIVDKLAVKHGVEPDEVEEVLLNRPRIRFVEKGRRFGENLYAATGQTDGGRYLLVLYVLKSDNSALIVSARDMTSEERRRHERK